MREFFLDPKTRRTDCLNGYGIQWRSFTECYLDSTGTFRAGGAVIGERCLTHKFDLHRCPEDERRLWPTSA
jgi:hypothetical protein